MPPNETLSSEQPSAPSKGRIRLIGAGPGDPELLTLKAFRAIQSADLVVADSLITPEILSLIPGKLFIATKKRAGKADESQDELMHVALEAVRAGQDVVRLKNGDPFVFGRGGEEVLFFRSHGFEPEVVPGISSSLAAPLSALIPVTHRGIADQFLVTTGQGKGGSIPSIPPFASHRTTIFLMSVTRMADLVKDLINHGYPEDCPVGIIEKATFPDQRVVRGLISNIVEISSKEQIQSPSTIVVGYSVNALVS